MGRPTQDSDHRREFVPASLTRPARRGGRVEVRVEVDRALDRAVLRVIDTGVGIEPELLARLFDPFSQAQQDIARSKGGLGLGLALTRGLAGLHGGDVEAHSDGGTVGISPRSSYASRRAS